MRLYLPADAAALRSLRDETSVTLPAFAAASDEEEDEFAALAAASETGTVVVVAEVDHPEEGDDQTVRLDEVVALHVDADGSGDLAWYATQELDVVLQLLS
jgi:hypothetical protein